MSERSILEGLREVREGLNRQEPPAPIEETDGDVKDEGAPEDTEGDPLDEGAREDTIDEYKALINKLPHVVSRLKDAQKKITAGKGDDRQLNDMGRMIDEIQTRCSKLGMMMSKLR